MQVTLVDLALFCRYVRHTSDCLRSRRASASLLASTKLYRLMAEAQLVQVCKH